MAEHAMTKSNITQKKKKKRIPSFNEIVYDDAADEESPSSPLRFLSPLRSDEPEAEIRAEDHQRQSPLARAIAPIRVKRRNLAPYPSQRTLRPQRSQRSPLSGPAKPSARAEEEEEEVVVREPDSPERRDLEPEPSPLPVVVVSRAVREEVFDVSNVTGSSRVGPGSGGGGGGSEEGGWARSVRMSRKVEAVRKAALVVRVLEVVMCVVSFSVMATDRTPGWSGDSYDRYKEYRYCFCLTIIAFVYSVFQAMNLAYNLATDKHTQSHLRFYFDFFMDQVLAYLLISASSSAATRVNDWESNWGKDEFTEKATTSVSMAFLAFIFFAISSMISGYSFVVVRNTIS